MKATVSNIRKYWAIFWQMQKINIMRRAAYPLSFFGVIITVIMVMALSILFMKVNFSYIHSLAGWSFYQVLVVMGSYMIAEGFMWSFCVQLNSVNMHIREGTLDGVLLKPVDDQFMVTFWKGDSEDLSRIVIGTALIIFALKNSIGFDFFHSVLFIFALLCGIIMLYSFNLMIRSASFWLIDGSGLWLLMERVTGNAQYPVDIYYHKFVRNALTFALPLAFVATFPAKILTSEKIDIGLVFLTILMTAFFFLLSRFFWKFSLKRYSSASS